MVIESSVSMSAGFSKCTCQACGQHLEFPLEVAGGVISCPQCNQEAVLSITETVVEDAAATEPEGAAESVLALSATDVAAAFGGRVPRTRVSLMYKAGLVLVSLGMVLLPLVYVALIGAVAGGVYYWATHFKSVVESIRGFGMVYVAMWVVYIAPLLIGAVLVFFMVKPLFAPRPPGAQPLALNPGAEPALFTFIAKVCETVGAPFPKRIDIDCHLNAAAGFRRGGISLLSNDLVLTIGLPLVAALSTREFAGVLAHEFGHFTQGFGLRMSYLIRRINGWFARVVYGRDAWDLRMDVLAETPEAWTAILIGFMRLAVWVSRGLLAGLMYVGHGISCFMLRQMEYDADSYEIKVVGSETFETTTRRVHLFSKALELAYKNMRVAWNINGTLPDNFPAFLVQTESTLAPGQRQQLEDTMGLQPTGWFDTHPSKGDRIRCARQAGEAGVFHLDGPASALFTNFEVPAKQVTLLHYAEDLGIELIMARLVPVRSATQVDAEVHAAEESRAAAKAPRTFRVPLRPAAE